MPDKETVVRAFIDAWTEADPKELADFFTDDAVVWNDVTTTVRGRDAIEEHFKTQLSVITELEFEILEVAVAGNVVFTERIDRMKVVGAQVELPVAGVFEVNDAGRIAAWRDYFDLNTVMTQIQSGSAGQPPTQ